MRSKEKIALLVSTSGIRGQRRAKLFEECYFSIEARSRNDRHNWCVNDILILTLVSAIRIMPGVNRCAGPLVIRYAIATTAKLGRIAGTDIAAVGLECRNGI